MAQTSTSPGFWGWLRGARTPAPAASTPPGASLKQQRAAHREQLFGVVRENMIRFGVLSSTYKFKVLTLDPAGQQFMVMVDWQPTAARTDAAHAQALEKGLKELAKERLGLRVKAVYWRHAGPVTAAEPVAGAAAAVAPVAAPAPVDPDAVSADELEAFRAALRSPGGASPLLAGAADHGRPVDFQPTEITEDPPATDFGSVSETQYGALR